MPGVRIAAGVSNGWEFVRCLLLAPPQRGAAKKGREGMKPIEQLRKEANTRNAEWGKLSPYQKLSALDGRPGKCAAQRERIRRGEG